MSNMSDILYFSAAAMFFIGGGIRIGAEMSHSHHIEDAEKAATIAATAGAVLLVAANATEEK